MNISPIHEKTWHDVEREIFTPEEIAQSNVRVAIMGELIKARRDRGISQRKLEEMTGIKQSVIARMETGKSSPKLETIVKILFALGKTFVITDLAPELAKAPAPTATPALERSR